MAKSEAAPSPKHELSVEEIGKRFVKLALSVRSKSDINIEKASDVFQFQMTPDSPDGSVFSKSGSLESGYQYVIEYRAVADPADPHGVSIMFNDANGAPACPLKASSFGNELEKDYFPSTDFIAPHDGEEGWRIAWDYYNFDAGIMVKLGVKMVPTSADKLNDQLCTMWIGMVS